MELKKYILPSILILGGGGALTAIFLVKRAKDKDKKEQDDFLKILEEQNRLSAQQLADLSARMEQAGKEEKEKLREDLLTQIGNVIEGKFAYAGAEDTNVRTSASVNNGWFLNNILVKVKAGERIGRVDKVVSSTEYGDKLKWYKVKLDVPKTGNEYGYVREDAAVIKNM